MAIVAIKRYPIAIVEVLILQRFPYGKESTFFYYAKEKLLRTREGDIVRIPWREKETNGVVVKTKKMLFEKIPDRDWKIDLRSQLRKENCFYSSLPQKVITLKPVIKILEREFFSPFLIAKLKEAAKNYLVSWNHFMCLAVELPPKRKISEDISVSAIIKKWQTIFKSNVSKRKFLRIEQKKIREVPFVFVSPEQIDYLQSLVLASFTREGQVLVLVPEKNQIIPTAAKYAALIKNFSQERPFIMGKILAESYFKKVWQAARRVTPAIFVGTRSAIFAPYKKLDLVVLENGHDASHKQWDMNPRYDLRDIIPQLYPQAAKIYVSATPRLQDFFTSPYVFKGKDRSLRIIKVTSIKSIKKGNTQALEKNQEKNISHILGQKVFFQGKRKSLVLINQRIENNLAEKETVLGNFIEESILGSLKKKKWALLLAPHKGWANQVLCKDCGNLLLCFQCRKPLVAGKNMALACSFCGYQPKKLDLCPKCRGNNFIFLNPGMEKIKAEAEKIKRKIDFSLIVPPENFTSFKKLRHFLDKLMVNRGKPTVFLGYAGIIALLKYFENQLALGIFLSFDNALLQPDFRSEERAVARFFNLLSLAPRVIVQSYHPDQPIFRELAKNSYSSFFARWAAERKPFYYPPFGKLIKLMLPPAPPWEVDRIIAGIKREKSVLDILKTLSPSFKNKKLANELLVKMLANSDMKDIAHFLPVGTKVDVDPERIG